MAQAAERTVEQDRNAQRFWGVAMAVSGGLALLDLAQEGGLLAVPGFGWLAAAAEFVPAALAELGLDGIFLYSFDRFRHYRREVKRKTGKAGPESKAPQIPLGPGRRLPR